MDAKLGATSKLKRNKEDQLEYLMESLEEARGNLEACIKSRSRLEEFAKKLDFESEEIEKKLETEMERSGRLRQDMSDLESQIDSNKSSFKEEVHRLKGAIKAEEQIAAGLKEFGVLLNTELEFLKRKFVIETKFKSKQEAYQKKLQVFLRPRSSLRAHTLSPAPPRARTHTHTHTLDLDISGIP